MVHSFQIRFRYSSTIKLYFFSYFRCRQTQAVFDQCMEDKMNITRPGFGYFCEIKVHESPRPAPKENKIVWEDTPDPIPQKPYPPGPKYGHESNAFKWNDSLNTFIITNNDDELNYDDRMYSNGTLLWRSKSINQ